MLLASITAVGCTKFVIPEGFGKDIRPNASAKMLTKGETVTTDGLGIFKMKAVICEYVDHNASESGTQPGGVFQFICEKDRRPVGLL